MRQFVAVAEELHFGRAAERLNMAQPPLSQSIKRLELELGVQLFDRSRRGVVLTEPGRVLLVEARHTLMQAELARTATRRAAETEGARVNVSFIGPALFRLLPAVLVAHREAYPDVEVRLFERSSSQQAAALMKGDMEVAFVHPSVALVDGDKHIVERTSCMAAVPSSWPLAQRQSVTLQELGEHPLILPPSSEAAHSVAAMVSAFRNVGVIPRVTQEATQSNTILSLIAAGLGCSPVMATASLTGRKNVTFVPIENQPSSLYWELAMVWRSRHMSKVARNFVKLVQTYVAEHPELLDPLSLVDNPA